jgi:hypothetical protein
VPTVTTDNNGNLSDARARLAAAHPHSHAANEALADIEQHPTVGGDPTSASAASRAVAEESGGGFRQATPCLRRMLR